jgi:hypothetical protein
MTLLELSKANIPESAAKPSSGSLGQGGKPKSSIVAIGFEHFQRPNSILGQEDFVVRGEGPLHLRPDHLPMNTWRISLGVRRL